MLAIQAVFVIRLHKAGVTLHNVPPQFCYQPMDSGSVTPFTIQFC